MPGSSQARTSSPAGVLAFGWRRSPSASFIVPRSIAARRDLKRASFHALLYLVLVRMQACELTMSRNHLLADRTAYYAATTRTFAGSGRRCQSANMYRSRLRRRCVRCRKRCLMPELFHHLLRLAQRCLEPTVPLVRELGLYILHPDPQLVLLGEQLRHLALGLGLRSTSERTSEAPLGNSIAGPFPNP